MTRAALLVPVLLLAACGGSRGPTAGGVAPSFASPTEVVTEFMQAVADSNLTRMGQLWGTPRGPAAVTGEPSNWQRRVVVIQLWLQGGTSRVIGEDRTAAGDRRTVTIDLARGGCNRQVPFTVLRQSNGSWMIIEVNLEAAGNPARPCNVP